MSKTQGKSYLRSDKSEFAVSVPGTKQTILLFAYASETQNVYHTELWSKLINTENISN